MLRWSPLLSSSTTTTTTALVVLFFYFSICIAFSPYYRSSSLSLPKSASPHQTTTTTTTTAFQHSFLKATNSDYDNAPTASNDSDASVISQKGVKVGVVGAGAIALGTSALLVQYGHDPMVWSPSNKIPENDLQVTSTGAIESKFTLRVAKTAQELCQNNDIVLFALPANGHAMTMKCIAPHIQRHQTIIISSHSSLGAIYLKQLLTDRGDGFVDDSAVPIVAWGTTILTARKQSANSVEVCTVRSLVDMCTIPQSESQKGLDVCRNLFRDRFKQKGGLLAISLSNLNAQNHLGIVIGNMSRMERNEKWSQGLNITPNIGRLLEALDKERLDIANELGFHDLRTIYDHFHLSFHVPIDTISKMNQEMVRLGNDVDGPATPNSRYVTEDVPYGLTLVCVLGKLVGRPAVLHEAGIRLMSAMYGRDFENENELLNSLNLDDIDVAELLEAGLTGIIKRNTQ